jgi:small subunit ribosomal protein S1
MSEVLTPSDEPNELDLYNRVVTATFVETNDQGFVFDLGTDQRAIVPVDEFYTPPTFEKGAEVDLLVEQRLGPFWSASMRKAEALATWDWLEGLLTSGEAIEGFIAGENRGGLSVDIGLRAFLPKSHIDLHRVDDVTPYIGRTERFQVIELDRKRGNIVVSRKNLAAVEQKQVQKALLDDLVPGKELDGVVRNITNFGAFVDVGGIDGLLHVTNMSWGRVDHPSELVRPGDKIRVVVLEWNQEKNRLGLGRKQLLPDPWSGVADAYHEGDVLSGKIVSLADFGAFVEIAPGLEGLVHVTELSWTGRIHHPREVLNMGQEVQVKILGVDVENRRLSLSIRHLEANPWERLAEEFPAGTRLKGTVRNITDYGLFVEIAPNIDGLVHVTDLSWTRKIDDPGDHYKVGDEVEVVVLDVDAESTRVSLGIKQLTEDPWDRAEALARPGQKIDVTIRRLTDFGAFAEIVEGVEGLIHISELSPDRVEKVTDVVRPGQEVKALVMSFDRPNQRISLSLKREELTEGEAQGDGEMREYTEESGSVATLGDILRDRLGLQSSDGEN